MTFISDILGLLKRPTEPSPINLRGPGRPRNQPPAAEIPVSEAEVTEALQNLLMERAEAEQVIAAAGAKRDKLLLTGGDDAVLAVGREIDAANLHLERLDRIEQELRGKLIEVRAATAQTKFSDFEAEFERGLDEFFVQFRAAIDAREKLVAIRQKVEEAGLQHRVGSLELPRTVFPMSYQAVAEFLGGRGATHHVNIRQSAALFPIEVTDGTHGAYNVGEVIGVNAEQGWIWVNGGMAKWADPMCIPPRSPSQEEPSRSRLTPQERLDLVFKAQGLGAVQ